MRSSPDWYLTPQPWPIAHADGDSDSPPAEAESTPDLDQIRARAYAEGVAEGRRQAEAEAAQALEQARSGWQNEQAAVEAAREEQLRHALSLLSRASEEMRAEASHWAETVEDNVIALALVAARWLLQAELESRPEQVRSIIESALARVYLGAGPIRVRLHPEDAQAVSRFGGELSSIPETTWVEDEKVARGGCIVELPDRLIDADVSTALETLYRTIRHA